jgi:hypothetical protein
MGRANPSFQKRQKEQKRKEKADDKRAARQAKGQAQPVDETGEVSEFAPVETAEGATEAAPPL